MHYLLIPFAVLSAMFVLHYHQQDRRAGNAGLVVVSGITMLVLFLTMLFRPVAGDSWRYYQYFLSIRTADFTAMLQDDQSDLLWKLLNWFIGQAGDSNLWLFGTTLVLYIGGFVWALRRLLPPVQVAALLMCYAAYPFFIAYGANGLRQGLALVCMLMALVQFNRGKRSGWLWLLPIPFWHGGSVIGAIVVAVFQWMNRWVPRERSRWALVLSVYGFSILLSLTGLNAAILGQLPDVFDIEARHQVYFMDPSQVGVSYRTGFRPDFALFSLLPLISAFLLRRNRAMFSFSASGWWLAVYLSLNTLYHLFSFAPFADRFSSFSWFLLPLVLFLQIRDTGNRWLRSLFIVGISAVNLAMLQFYTGNFIPPPEWW